MTPEEKIDKLVTDVAEIRTALKYNGSGLIPAFTEHCKQDREFRKDYYKFKRTCIGTFFFILGSGVLGAGAYSLIELFKGL